MSGYRHSQDIVITPLCRCCLWTVHGDGLDGNVQAMRTYPPRTGGTGSGGGPGTSSDEETQEIMGETRIMRIRGMNDNK